MTSSGYQDERWVARLRPLLPLSVDDLLQLPMSFDVWQRDGDALVASVSEATLGELERRKLATVDRICTVADYLQRSRSSNKERPE